MTERESFKVHVIGDSHVSLFVGKELISSGLPCTEDCLPPFRTYRIGSHLAYSLGDPGHNAVKRMLEIICDIPKTDAIMLCFGEVDCRVHLVKQSEKQGRPIEDLAREVADRYANFAESVMRDGRQVFVYAPPPTCNYHNPKADVTAENPYPHIGTTQERNRATLAMTERLKERFPRGVVLDIFWKLVNEDMTSKGEYFMDGVHLSQKAMPIVMAAFDVLLKENHQNQVDYIFNLHPY